MRISARWNRARPQDLWARGKSGRRTTAVSRQLRVSGRRTTPSCCFGPNFSGGMDSVGQHLGRLLGPEITDFCLVSSSATNSSNPLAEDAYDHLNYVQLAADDGAKLLRLADLAEAFGYFDPDGKESWSEAAIQNTTSRFSPRRPRSVMASAIHGGRMESEKLERIRAFCARAYMLSFPAAVADIRYGIEQQREKQQNDVQAAMKIALPSEHLTLEAGAENGSEFPENRQSNAHGSEPAARARSRARTARAIRSEDGDRRRYRCPRSPVPVRSTSPSPAERHAHRSGNGHPARVTRIFCMPAAAPSRSPRRISSCAADDSSAVKNAALEGSVKKRVAAFILVARWPGHSRRRRRAAVRCRPDAPRNRPASCKPGMEAKYGSRAPILHVVTLNGLRRISRVADRRAQSRFAVHKAAENAAEARRYRPVAVGGRAAS